MSARKVDVKNYCLGVSGFPEHSESPNFVCEAIANSFYLIPLKFCQDEYRKELIILFNKPVDSKYRNRKLHCSIRGTECELTINAADIDDIPQIDEWLHIIQMTESRSETPDTVSKETVDTYITQTPTQPQTTPPSIFDDNPNQSIQIHNKGYFHQEEQDLVGDGDKEMCKSSRLPNENPQAQLDPEYEEFLMWKKQKGSSRHPKTDNTRQNAMLQEEKVSASYSNGSTMPCLDTLSKDIQKDQLHERQETDILEVSKLPNDVTEEALSMFFGKKKFAQDAKLLGIVLNKKEKKAFLKYDKADAVTHICKKEVVQFHDSDVCLTPFTGDVKVEKENKTLKITGFNPNTSVEMIDMYFESKKRSGASAEEIKSFKEDGYTLVTYSTIDDVTTVLSRDHILDGDKLTVQYYEEEIPDLKAIKVSGFKPSASFQFMELYFENEKKCGAEAEKVELSEDKKYLLVTFNTTEEAEVVCNREHIIDGCKLTVELFNPSTQLDNSTHDDGKRIVRVSGYKDTTSNDMIEMYIESKKRFGAVPENIEINEEEKCAYVTLSTDEDAELVCEKEHTLDGCKLTVELFNPLKEEEESESNGTILMITGFNKKTTNEKMKLYLRNKRKFGADPVNIEFDDDENCIFVTLSSPEDAKEVCDKDHKVGKNKLKVVIYTPPPLQNNRLLVTNINQDTKKETLQNYLEGKLDIDVFNILYNEEGTKAVLTYKDKKTVKEILKKFPSVLEALEGNKLKIKGVAISKIARVSKFTDGTDDEDLTNYFESYGGVERVEMYSDNDYALVHFQNPKDLENVCKKSHELGGISIEVVVYQPCLGKSGGIKNPHIGVLPKKPVKITLTECDKYKMMFIYESETNKQQFQSKMTENNTLIEWSKDISDVLLSCTVSKEMKDARKLSKNWTKMCEKHFQDYLGSLKIRDFKLLNEVSELVWKEITNLNKDDVNIFKGSDSSSSIIIVGHDAPQYQEMESSIQQIQQRIEEDFERKKQEVSETMKLKYPYSVLESLGFLDIVLEKYQHLQILKKTSDLEIELKGIFSDITAAKVTIYELLQNFKTSQMKNFSKTQIKILFTKDVHDFIIKEKFQGDKSIAVWLKNEEGVSIDVFAKDKKSLNLAESVLNDVVCCKHLPVDKESVSLLTQPKWQDLNEDIKNTYPDLVKICPISAEDVEITAFSEVMQMVEASVAQFFEENTTYEKITQYGSAKDRFFKNHYEPQVKDLELKLESCKVIIQMKDAKGIVFKGTKQGIMKAQEHLKELYSKIICKEKNINSSSYCKFIQSEKGKRTVSNIERMFRCTIEVEEETIDTTNSLNCASFQLKNTQILVVKGDITDLNVDVIVNAANDRLQHIGGLAGHILQKGGQIIQDECKAHIQEHGQVYDGDCMMSGSGRLNCKKIVHAVGPRWAGGHSNESKILSTTILRTLELIMTHGYSSVALPAISTGIFGYPVKNATKVIVQAIAHHFERVPQSPIKSIYLIDIQNTSLKFFIEALKGESSILQLNSAGVPQESIPRRREPAFSHGENFEQDDQELVRLTPCLIKGEIAKAVVDVIVNSTSNKLELQNGAVSSSINKAAGPNLQAECKEKYPNGINVGDIAVTGPGKLSCQKVYHTCLSSFNKASGEKNLENLILKCLRKAEAGGYKSIAFPAIGTGNLGFPRDLVARVFYQTINDYKSQGGTLKVNDIKLIVYPGDAATVKEFTDEDNNTGSKTKKLKSKPERKATSDPRGAESYPEDIGFHIVTKNEIGRGIKVGKFKLSVTNGDLLEVNVPVIVNSSNSDLNLTMGAVSQAILKAGKERILQECDKARDVMKEKGIAITPVSGMNCQYVIHVDADRFNDNWKKAIASCLREADKKNVTSIAFPALGTGNYSTKTTDIAEAMVKALNNTTNLKYLQNVHVVIYQESMFNPFVGAMQGAIQKSGKGLWNRLTSYVSTSFGFGSNDDDDDDFPMDSEANPDFSPRKEPEIREKILYFYSDDAEQITLAMASLDQTHREDFHKQRIDYNVKLSDNKLRKILKNESDGVKIAVDETLKRIIIEGLTRDVANVANKVNEIILNAVEEERDVKHADILKDVIQWSRLETAGARPYPAHINKKIEDAFNLNETTFSFLYNQNKNVINFDDMEVSEEGGHQKQKVIRQDKMKEAKLGIPKHWQIDDKSNLNVVTLAASDPEYLKVQANFAASGQNVKKIERIENRSLYEQYVSKKRQMELELPSTTVEKDILWHGTDENSIFSINNYGFNRSYCGKNATVHGQGVYFAVNSSYSVNYARKNTSGLRQMYQCKVLVGDYTQGNSAYRVPPNKPGGTQVYNSLVDNTSNPSMYIIFNDTQAYPEYLITF
ncbi:hypothetical protein SNE40_013346 [Patella caerulea]|uniref:Poly [ADP-ribose] polymerase n=1 Tax=Patella caerulea TaxID=87958 RepID=A0AAN8JJE5_PATCE